MNNFRNKIIVMFITLLTLVLALTFSLLQVLDRAPALISSVSWNL